MLEVTQRAGAGAGDGVEDGFVTWIGLRE
jgi:hypothetical protein